MGTWVSHVGLKVASSFCLLKLFLAKSFGLFLHSCYEGQLPVVRVMVVESIGVHDEMDVDAVGFVHNKSTSSVALSVAVISNAIFVAYVLEGKNVGDGLGVIPYVSIVVNMGFVMCG